MKTISAVKGIITGKGLGVTPRTITTIPRIDAPQPTVNVRSHLVEGQQCQRHSGNSGFSQEPGKQGGKTGRQWLLPSRELATNTISKK